MLFDPVDRVTAFESVDQHADQVERLGEVRLQAKDFRRQRAHKNISALKNTGEGHKQDALYSLRLSRNRREFWIDR